ncbi:MAG: LPS export ABC transporter periplasmic protein LptC [Desulfocapsaceae bacterium]|nr:LPS export ABC transporter periplasmic protein LptC [Desulfocapsaceae bacterium]
MISRRNSVWLIPLVLILTFPFWQAPVARFLAPRGGYDPEFANRKTDEHHFVIENANILQTDKGVKTADIRAARALTGTRPNDFLLEAVNADIYSDNGEKTNVTARNGLYNTVSRQLVLTTKVIAIREKDNYRLYTDRLDYNDNTKKVICPGTTRIAGNGVEIIGSSMTYSLLQNTYDVGGRVHASMQGFGHL